MVAKPSKLVRSAILSLALAMMLVGCASLDSPDPNGLSAETAIRIVSIASRGDNITLASIELVEDEW